MLLSNEQIEGYLDLIYEKIPLPDLKCLRCGECCKSDVRMAFIEYLNIKHHIVSDKIKPFYNNKKCIFLKHESQPVCIIHSHRPWICRAYRPFPKNMTVYYVDIKKIRTTERCGYPAVDLRQGKPRLSGLEQTAFIIHELQQVFKEFIDAPEGFFHRDDTFVGWQQECRSYVKNSISRNKRR